MNEIIFLNDRFIPAAGAGIPVTDSGFLFGEGVFETVRADLGRPFRLTAHLERLGRGLKLLGLAKPPALERAPAVCLRLLAENRLQERPAVLKLVVSGGRPATAGNAAAPTFLVRATALDLKELARRRAGLRAGLIPWRRDPRNPLIGIKSLNYLENRLALQWARRAGFDEGIFTNCAGELCEGSFSNLFLIRGKTLLTPPESSGLLAGITRRFILGAAPGLGLKVRETPLRPEQVADSAGAFLTSSLMDLAPLRELAGCRFAPEATEACRSRLLQAFTAARRENPPCGHAPQ